MKNLFLTIVCTCMALALMAAAPKSDVATSRQALKSKSVVASPSTRVDKVSSKSLHQLMRERKLNLNDNRVNKKAPHRITAEELPGSRIAVMEACALDDFDGDGYFTLSDTVYSLGWATSVFHDEGWDYGPYKYYGVDNFYGKYQLPLEFNEETGEIAIFSCDLEHDSVSVERSRHRYDTIRTTTVYTFDDFFNFDGSDINGEFSSDGSIVFDGCIMFYTEVIYKHYFRNVLRSTDTLAYITPVIGNIILLQPNGIHECDVQEISTSSGDPFFIKWTEDMVYQVQSSYIDISRVGFVPGGGGYNPPAITFGSGGLVPRPIDPRKPKSKGGSSTFNMTLKGDNGEDITPVGFDSSSTLHVTEGLKMTRFGDIFDPLGGGGHSTRPIDFGRRKTPIDGTRYSTPYGLTGNATGDVVAQTMQVPVYMYQCDDSTLIVYNLFNLGSTANGMLFHQDGTMTLPGQALFFDEALNDDFCNYSMEGDSLHLGNSGLVTPDTISWAATVPHGLLHSYSRYYDNNRLYFTDGSQFVLPVAPSIRRGDVNRNGEVNIGDVTALINALLSEESDDNETFSWNNANVNQDDKLSIADVTVLINYLLSGTWP